MTERKRAEEAEKLQHEVDLAIRTANFQTALHVVLKHICEVTSWEYGEAWIPNGKILELSPVWYSIPNTEALEKFRLCSEAFILSANKGLPGRVWASKQPEWIVDVSTESETYFLRNQIAKACGVKAGFGIPVMSCDRASVVIVFFMRQAQLEDKRVVELVTLVKAQLEQALQHLGI